MGRAQGKADFNPKVKLSFWRRSGMSEMQNCPENPYIQFKSTSDLFYVLWISVTMSVVKFPQPYAHIAVIVSVGLDAYA